MKITERVTNVEVTMAAVTEKATAAHRRLDEHNRDILSLRDSRHEHSNMLQNHNGIISGMAKSVGDLVTTVDRLSSFANRLVYVSIGGIAVGTSILGMILYICKEMLKLW